MPIAPSLNLHFGLSLSSTNRFEIMKCWVDKHANKKKDYETKKNSIKLLTKKKKFNTNNQKKRREKLESRIQHLTLNKYLEIKF